MVDFKCKTYKDLIAWQKAYSLCLETYALTKRFPNEEKYGLVSQLNRCAVSIPSNIAEGYTRKSTADYIRFLYMSYSSLAELETQLLLSKDLNFINKENFKTIIKSQNEVQRIMMGLIKSLKQKKLR